MEALALFAITMSIAAAQEAEYRHRMAHGYPAPVVQEEVWQHATYAPAIGPAPVLGAITGAAVASQAGAPALFGAAMGGLVGHAVSTPQVVVYPVEPLARRASGSGFIERWQGFMQPATGR